MGMPSCEAMPSRTRATLAGVSAQRVVRLVRRVPAIGIVHARDGPDGVAATQQRFAVRTERPPALHGGSGFKRLYGHDPHHGAVVPDLSSIRVERRVHGVGGRDPPESPGRRLAQAGRRAIDTHARRRSRSGCRSGGAHPGWLAARPAPAASSGRGPGGNSATMSLPGSPRLSWLIQSSNHGARLAHAPERAGRARTACRSRCRPDRRRR